MEHLSFAIHILAIGTCWASILVSLLLFLKLKKSLIKQFGLFISTLFLILISLGIIEYSHLTGVDFKLLSRMFNMAGSTGFVIITPIFFHELFAIPWGRRENLIFGFLNVILIVTVTLFLFNQDNRSILLILQILLFGNLSYGLIRGGLSAKNIGNNSFRKYLRQLLITSLLFLPLMIGDSVLGELPFLPNNLALPLFFITVSILSLTFMITVFDTAPFLKSGQLTSDFYSEFKLTQREGEVVTSLLKGHSNREIGEECFISVKTVENHLTAVYQKCDVKNRAQLMNLIQTNSAL